MRRLLFIENEEENKWPETVIDLFSKKEFNILTLFARREQFPTDLSGFDGIFISGSVNSAYDDLEWIHREHDFIRLAAEKNIPMLGSCFGSQILASALCGPGQVFRREHCEVGYIWVTLHHAANDPLTRGIPGQVQMLVWHNDEVRSEHENILILGSSKDCPNQIWRYKGKPIWGIQGHPELNAGQIGNVLDIYHDYFMRDGADIPKIKKQARDNEQAIKLIQNFIDFILVEYL